MENQSSMTALLTSFARAYHALHASYPIFDDSLSAKLFSEEEQVFFGEKLAEALKFLEPERGAIASQSDALDRYMRIYGAPAPVSRARYTEECLRNAINHGVRQYVILGAGFDTFAFRNQQILDRLDVFEVDHPATQVEKKRRITQAGWLLPPQLHFVPIDFTKEKIGEVLSRSSYDHIVPTFFSLLGVTYYLPHHAVIDVLRNIADIAPKGSMIVFDYMDANAFDPNKASRRVRRVQAMVKNVGEPFKTGFDSRQLEKDLAQMSWSVEERLSPSEIEARFFHGRTDGSHAAEHTYFLRAFMK